VPLQWSGEMLFAEGGVKQKLNSFQLLQQATHEELLLLRRLHANIWVYVQNSTS